MSSIPSFLEFLKEKKIKERQELLEASLSRIHTHAESGRSYAVISAFRGKIGGVEISVKDNKIRSTALENDIRRRKYGYFAIRGYWIEKQGTPEERKVIEISMFVLGPKKKNNENYEKEDERFTTSMVSLGRKYRQEEVVIRNRNGIGGYDKKGKQVRAFKGIKYNKIGEFYSELRNKKNATFVFQEIDNENNKE